MEKHTQYLLARQIVILIRGMVGDGGQPIKGYNVAGDLIGVNGTKYARALGQACSLIDAASLHAGWPMLALHWVRMPNGKLNAESFGSEWAAYSDRIRSTAVSHVWTVSQVNDVIRALDALPQEGARAQWAYALKREQEKGSNFMQYNLHRKLRA